MVKVNISSTLVKFCSLPQSCSLQFDIFGHLAAKIPVIQLLRSVSGPFHSNSRCLFDKSQWIPPDFTITDYIQYLTCVLAGDRSKKPELAIL